MSGHTPGPWVARQSGSFTFQAFDIEGRGRLVTCLSGSIYTTAEQDEAMAADARLIAAAPEMLEALEAVVGVPSEHAEDCPVGFNDCCCGLEERRTAALLKARAAIAKARAP